MKIRDIYIKIKKQIQGLELQRVTYFSAQASFYMIISVFPFLILLITVAGLLPSDTVSTVWAIPSEILPNAIKEFAEILINEAKQVKSSRLLIAVSSITALWSSSRGTLSLIRGLDYFLNTPEKGGWIYKRVKSCVFTVLIVVLIIVAFALLVIWEKAGNAMLKLLNIQYNAVSLLLSYRMLLSFLVLTLSFMLVFSFMPGRRTKLKNNFWGAALSSAGWITFSSAFSMYVTRSTLTVYGSLTMIVFFMLWIYFCISIIFVGAILNRHLEERRSKIKLK